MASIFLMLSGSVMADVSDRNAELIQTAAKGSLAGVNAALDDGAEINAKGINNSGATALMWASDNGNSSIVKLLLENGAEVNARNTASGVTALWTASQYGYVEIAKILLEKGADVNIRATIDNVEYTALPLIEVLRIDCNDRSGDCMPDYCF